MQIPLTLPEQTTPLPTRRDIQALSPVSPVPGVEAQAETLDPRLALQWTQPVLGDHAADLARSVLDSVTTPEPPAGQSPQPAAPAPIVAWSTLAQTLGPMLQRMGSAASLSAVAWPADAPSTTSRPQPEPADGSRLMEALHSLRNQLAQSDVFAAHHLVRHWFKPPDDSTHAAIAGQKASPDSDTVSRWVSALSADSATAEDITRMLVNGRMQWQGELLPGIAVTLDREDAWREDPQHPGQAQKGASLKAQIDLPRLGRLTVVAYQWAEHIDLRVVMPTSAQASLESAWPVLEDRLSHLQFRDLRVERATAS